LGPRASVVGISFDLAVLLAPILQPDVRPQPVGAWPCHKAEETDMGHSLGDGLIVLALAGALVAYWYFRHVERQRRLELAHQERLVAMEKGIPLLELPIDPPSAPRARDPHAVLIHGIVWLAFGVGGMGAAYLTMLRWNGQAIWPLLLPPVLLGVGLVLYFVLASNRTR
jgi:hypothetical protein